MSVACIVADPPRQPKDKLPGNGRGAAKHYTTMSTDDLCRFLGETWANVADDCILLLWRLASMQEDALRVADAWGFRAVSEIVWQKLTKNGLPHFGMGRTVRASHETALVCVRGRASRVIRNRSVRSTFAAPIPCGADGRPIHSAKPDEFFSIVEELCAGPYLEIFARKRRDRWLQIGNQLGSR